MRVFNVHFAWRAVWIENSAILNWIQI
jgi:hypothetical protein